MSTVANRSFVKVLSPLSVSVCPIVLVDNAEMTAAIWVAVAPFAYLASTAMVSTVDAKEIVRTRTTRLEPAVTTAVAQPVELARVSKKFATADWDVASVNRLARLP